MNILIAPNAFKESLSAQGVGEAVKRGFLRALPDAKIRIVPIADGGDGTLDALSSGGTGKLLHALVSDPLGKRFRAPYVLMKTGKAAVVEMSRASGLALVPPAKRNPMIASSVGTGELLLAAVKSGAKKIILGIGGSATVDGGIGALSALGIRFLDQNGHTLSQGGEDLLRIRKIELSHLLPEIKNTSIQIACDVTSPLIGRKGAAAVYGPQKGATPRVVKTLDKGLASLADLIQKLNGKKIAHLPGAGAAGGIAGSFHGLLGATLKPGSELVFDLLGMKSHLDWADLVVTGEGRMDFQTAFGKAPGVLAKWADEKEKPVIALAGGLGENVRGLLTKGFSSVFTIVPGPVSLENAMQNARPYLEYSGEQIARTLSVGRLLR